MCQVILFPMYVCVCSRAMEEQAGDLEDMYDKRMELYRKSVKKENRKRRRREEGTYLLL